MKHPRAGARYLPSETEITYERSVAIDVFTIKVVKQTSALANKSQQASSGAVVVLVLAQVIGQLGNPSCQQRYLNF